MAACQAAKDEVWLRAFLVGLGLNASAPTSIQCDSQGAMHWRRTPSIINEVNTSTCAITSYVSR